MLHTIALLYSEEVRPACGAELECEISKIYLHTFAISGSNVNSRSRVTPRLSVAVYG